MLHPTVTGPSDGDFIGTGHTTGNRVYVKWASQAMPYPLRGDGGAVGLWRQATIVGFPSVS